MGNNIPKIISFYWGGGSLSHLQYMTAKSFSLLNPDWEIRLFIPVENNVIKSPWKASPQKVKYEGKDFLKDLKEICNVFEIDFQSLGVINENMHEVHRSDLIRWHLLFEHGGIWSDIDILYIKPIDLYLDSEHFDFTVTLRRNGRGFPHVIGFYIAKPKQQIFKDLFDRALFLTNEFVLSRDYQVIGATMLNKMIPTIKSIQDKYNTKFTNMPMEIVYPYNSSNEAIKRLFSSTVSRVTDRTIGVHWYNGHGIAKNYLNNYEQRVNDNSTISTLLKQYYLDIISDLN